jgi:hypothetical protein
MGRINPSALNTFLKIIRAKYENVSLNVSNRNCENVSLNLPNEDYVELLRAIAKRV